MLTSKLRPIQCFYPLLSLFSRSLLDLYLTGDGDIFKGSGSTSVYYAVIVTLLFMYLYFVLGKTLTHKRYFEGLYEGIGDMIPVGLIMVFALLIGKVIGELGTAQYLADLLSGNISPIYHATLHLLGCRYHRFFYRNLMGNFLHHDAYWFGFGCGYGT